MQWKKNPKKSFTFSLYEDWLSILILDFNFKNTLQIS